MDYEETIQQAKDELRERLAALHQVREKVQEASTRVRSADGMITVVVNGQGELSSLTFNTAKFRRMPPAELAAALVQTINRARQQSREELVGAFGPLLPQGAWGLGGAGKASRTPEEMFDNAMRKTSELLGEDWLSQDAPRQATRQEE